MRPAGVRTGGLESLDDCVCLYDLVCPGCGRPAEDMRNTGFDPKVLRREGRCFWFNKGTWECNGPQE